MIGLIVSLVSLAAVIAISVHTHRFMKRIDKQYTDPDVLEFPGTRSSEPMRPDSFDNYDRF